MLVHLIVSLLMGATAVLFVWAGFRTFRRRPPRYAMPMAAGAAILAYAVYADYTWVDRSVKALPEGMVVVQTVRAHSPLAPWTYLWPTEQRFTAVNPQQFMRNPADPGRVLFKLYLFSRYQPAHAVPMLMDCADNSVATVDEADFRAKGMPADLAWNRLADGDPLLKAVCGSGQGAAAP